MATCNRDRAGWKLAPQWVVTRELDQYFLPDRHKKGTYMVRIYTRTGDDGSSALIGGKRVSKNSLRLEAYGTVDELNSFLGQAISQGATQPLVSMLQRIQNTLFDVGAELASEVPLSPPRMHPEFIVQLERWIDDLSDSLPPLTQFILPGGSQCAATFHVARTVCRRAERRVISLHELEPIHPDILRYLNRLSDLLFVMARTQNQWEGHNDIVWEKTKD